MTAQRPFVLEHRVTTNLGGYIVRYWIEADPKRGGVWDREQAGMAVAAGERMVEEKPDLYSPGELARVLLHNISSANSIEVCDESGNGVAVHRDWP